MNQIIEIIIASDGQSRVETRGFTGNDCRTSSRFLEQALGKQVDEHLKPEFHQTISYPHKLRENQ